jgi:dihydrofolate synthase / folylpolyglutamate synthase
VGEHQAASSAVFEKMAAGQNAALSFADQQKFIADWKFENHKLVAEVTSTHSNDKQYYHLDLTGIYQTRNLLTVLESVHILRRKGWNLPEDKVKKGLSQVKRLTGLYGRWESIQQQPLVILDVGHNEEGIRQITRQIEITDHEELHIVIGLVKDKEIEKILALLPRHGNFYFTKAQIPRALPEDQLAEIAHTLGLKGGPYPDVNSALQTALNNCSKKDLIVVCGSVFVVGEVMLH